MVIKFFELSKISTLVFFMSLILGCSGSNKQAKIKYQSQQYASLASGTQNRNNSYLNTPPNKDIILSDQISSIKEEVKKENTITTVENKKDKEKKQAVQISSISSPKIEKTYANDIAFEENRYIILKNVSKYFGERKIKSILYAVGDFNKWGKDKLNQITIYVDKDEAKLDLYKLPLLKGTNRIGFADYSNNLWNITDDLSKNKVLVQSTSGEWVIGIIVTHDGVLTLYNTSNGNGQQKLIPQR